MFKRIATTGFRRVGWLVVLGIAAAVAAGISYAAIASSGGTISACMDARGTLKVIDAESGVSCGAGKQLLSWNEQGPQGIPGQQGAKGDPGPQGAKGDPGLQGLPGVSGYELVAGNSSINSNYLKEIVLECPPGKKPLGGGGYIVNPTNGAYVPGVALTASYQNTLWGEDVWIVTAREIVATDDIWQLNGQVACGAVR